MVLGQCLQDPPGLFLMLIASWPHNGCCSSSPYISFIRRNMGTTAQFQQTSISIWLARTVSRSQSKLRGSCILPPSLCTRGRKGGKNWQNWIRQPMIPSRDVKLKSPLKGWEHYQWLIYSLVESSSDILYLEMESVVDGSFHDPGVLSALMVSLGLFLYGSTRFQ